MEQNKTALDRKLYDMIGQDGTGQGRTERNRNGRKYMEKDINTDIFTAEKSRGMAHTHSPTNPLTNLSLNMAFT